MYEGRGQRIVRVPQSVLVTGAKQVFPYPVEYEDDGLSTLALVFRSAAGDDITSLEWHGDAVLTGPIVDPGGLNPEIDMAILAAAAVAAGFTARASGNTAYFTRDDGRRVGGYGGIDLVRTGTTSIFTATAVRSVVQDLRDGPVPADIHLLGPDHAIANAADPDGGSALESHSHSIAQGSYVLDLATYTVHEVGVKLRAKGGARTAARSSWAGWKFRTRLDPEPSTLDWDSLDSITGGPTEWGEEHPIVPIPAFVAEGRVYNLDGAADAFVDGVRVKPNDFVEIECARVPFIVTPSAAGCRVEFYYEMEGY